MSSSRHREHHRKTADHAGLLYVTDGIAGITRLRSGKGWSYYDPRGELIRDRALRKRLASLAIPPGWSDVWICPDPDGHIQATARDARGRKQYRYHPSYRDARDQSKFRRMLEFSEALPLLRERIEHDLRSDNLGRHQLLATVLRLLDKTLIRVGNDEYARANRSFGLTTLRRRHVKVNGSTLRFTFRGKSGVDHSIAVTDLRLARIVQRCQDLPGQEMFQYVDSFGKRQSITSDDVNEYLREISGRDITAKDFRTWGGTMLAALELRAMGPASSRRPRCSHPSWPTSGKPECCSSAAKACCYPTTTTMSCCRKRPSPGLSRPNHSIPTPAARRPRATSGTSLRQPTARPT